jgi:uncharacterized protein (DUF1778 family)
MGRKRVLKPVTGGSESARLAGDKAILVRVSAAQHAAIFEAAHEARQPMGTFVREAALRAAASLNGRNT